MPSLHTHYDNLKVSRDAPLEIIRAAYKALSQKYHPDRNHGDAEATRIMALINASYDVLSDPDKRRQHDRWIAKQESGAKDDLGNASEREEVSPGGHHASPPNKTGWGDYLSRLVIHFTRYWSLYGVAIFGALIYLNDSVKPVPAAPNPYSAIPPAEAQNPFDQFDASADSSSTTTSHDSEFWMSLWRNNRQVKSWPEVVASREFKALGAKEQEEARNEYWAEVVEPNVPAKSRAAVRRLFDHDTVPREKANGGSVDWSQFAPIGQSESAPKVREFTGKLDSNGKGSDATVASSYSVAPNGEPWPRMAGYVKDYERLNSNGLSSVTVDNTRNEASVFVKLVALGGARSFPVRAFFIPSGGSFTVKNVTAGRYDVRYRDLSTGELARSEAFVLEEVAEADGTRFSEIRMTLYKVRNGNMKTQRIGESEF